MRTDKHAFCRSFYREVKKDYETKFGAYGRITAYAPLQCGVNTQYEVQIDDRVPLWISADCVWHARAEYMLLMIERAERVPA